ncbi:MAG: TonB-dependent receptor [Opitutaceae bacterium]|nr:TonB-dependent receptor [Opitutaceae bacterium]
MAAAWLAWLLTLSWAVAAPDHTARPFRIPAGSASETLKQFAEQAQREILFPSESVADVRTPRLFGDYPPREALDRLLAGTRLRALEAADTGGFVISPAASGPDGTADTPAFSKPMKTKSTFAAIAGWFALGAATAAPAQPAARPEPAERATGIIEGRVSSAVTGEGLELARVTVEGTPLEAFTEAGGRYRVTNVPAGSARVKVFRTGAAEQVQPAVVAAGGTVQLDFALGSPRSGAAGDATVKLDAFVVASAKEMDNAAYAINTQRFAANQMNVVAAEEFGGAAESKIGEVLKSLPGVSMGLGGGGEPFLVSLDGVPPDNVPVTIGGFSLASSLAGTARQVGLHQSAINVISRIEIVNTPTPETSGAALAGSVNMVPLSAFERARPSYTLSTSLSFRDEARSLRRTPGPTRDPSHKIRPGFEFTGVVPVNKRFGFALSAGASTLYRVQDMSQPGWRGTALPTTVLTAAPAAQYPDTTPDRPYLTDYSVRDGGAMVTAANFGATIDWQVGPNDQLSFAFQWAFSDFALTQRVLQFFVNRVAPGNFSTTFTRGMNGAGEVRINNTVNGLGGNLYMPTLTWRHNGPVWQAEAGAGLSQSLRWRKDATRGNFFNSVARRQNLTISYDDIFYLRPGRITVTDGTTGLPFDPHKLDGYLFNTASTNAFETLDRQQTAYANVRRSFSGRTPLTLKAGLDLRRQTRDTRNTNPTLTFVGRDGIANNADDAAAIARDASYSGKVAPFGFPATEWTSNENLWDIYQANPGYFTENRAASYTQQTALSRWAQETISSGFLRADTRLAEGRLRLVGGVRAEQTNVRTQSRLADPTRNFRRDAGGRVILNPNGTPAVIATDALEAARLTNIDRGFHAEKEYLRWFPSVNASYAFTGGLIARAGYYWSVGRPDFNQYGGNVTLPNTENPPGPNNRLAINNAGIKAWSARTTKVALEYYFEPVGLVSVTAFQREFKDMFGATVVRATPEFLALYGLNPTTYGDYDVATQANLPDAVKTTGVSFNYKQALTFLPAWARGVSVFANASAQRVTGDTSNSFSGYTPRLYNWGLSLSRPKFTIRANWNYAGRKRLGPVAAGRSIAPGTFNWSSKRLVADLNADYRLTARLTLFANLNNVFNDPVDNEVYGPATPEVAQFRMRQNYGSLWTFGLRGKF